MQRTIGVIAGLGRLPECLAAAAKRDGATVVAIRGLPDALGPKTPACDHVYDIYFGQWERILGTLKRHGAETVYLAGKFSREHLLRSGDFDARFMSIVSAPGRRNDDALTARFVADLERAGMVVGTQMDYLQDLCCEPGVLTSQAPGEQAWQDIARGHEIAKAVSGLDVGQTVVVKEGAIVAVEAVEGTDAAIARGCDLAGGGAVVVKVAKPSQDLRFDVPTIGVETVETMAAHRGGVLAFDAERTFTLERETMISIAESHGIAVVSYTPGMEAEWIA